MCGFHNLPLRVAVGINWLRFVKRFGDYQALSCVSAKYHYLILKYYNQALQASSCSPY